MKNINFFVYFPAPYFFFYLHIGRIVNGRGMSETTECSFLNDIKQIR